MTKVKCSRCGIENLTWRQAKAGNWYLATFKAYVGSSTWIVHKCRPWHIERHQQEIEGNKNDSRI